MTGMEEEMLSGLAMGCVDGMVDARPNFSSGPIVEVYNERFRHPVLLRSQRMDADPTRQQSFLDPMLVQVPLEQSGVFIYSRREGRTADQKTSR